MPKNVNWNDMTLMDCYLQFSGSSTTGATNACNESILKFIATILSFSAWNLRLALNVSFH